MRAQGTEDCTADSKRVKWQQVCLHLTASVCSSQQGYIMRTRKTALPSTDTKTQTQRHRHTETQKHIKYQTELTETHARARVRLRARACTHTCPHTHAQTTPLMSLSITAASPQAAAAAATIGLLHQVIQRYHDDDSEAAPESANGHPTSPTPQWQVPADSRTDLEASVGGR